MLSLLVLMICSAGSVATEPVTAEAMSLRILDGEALYTVTGGLKPVSDGFWTTQFPATRDSSPDVDQARKALALLALGSEIEAGVFVFAAPFDGKKYASAFVVHKPSLRALVIRRLDVFGPLGITADTAPQEVMEKIDRGPRAGRWRAFGLVFGYPEFAVEFFVAAGEEQAKTQQIVSRDFIRLPTFGSNGGRFVYAVPKGHVERTEDRLLKINTEDILSRYRAWRAVYLDDRKLGAVELLKNWIAFRDPVRPVLSRTGFVAQPCCSHQPFCFPIPGCRRRFW